jgi:tetratricopeptide (TPR) repeat protein
LSPAWTIAAAILSAAILFWWVGGVAVRRVQAARLPSLPPTGIVPDAAYRQLVDADTAARAAPTSAAAVGDLGIVYHASLLMMQADHAYAVAETLAADDWRWTYYRGLIHEERGEHDAARAAFERVAAADSGQGLAWYRLAEIAFKQGRVDDAEQAYARARDSTPTSTTVGGLPARRATPLRVYAQVGLARIDIERGRLDDARVTLDAVLQQTPRFGAARSLRRQVETGDPPPHDPGSAFVPPADPLLDAIVARSLHTDLLLKHAALAARGGDSAWRQRLARQALTANPRGLDVLLEMAAMLQAAGRHIEALEYLRQCEEVAPGDHHTLVEQGKSLSELGRLDEAEQVLRRAVRVRDAAAEYNLGTVLDRMDRWDEARQHYERALAIDPFHARALNNLGVGLDRRGRGPEALVIYARAIAAAPGNAETYSNLGSALIGQQRFADAIRALDTAITLEPDAPDAHNNRGIALAQSGRLLEARAAFETALRIAPNHVDARPNLAALAGRQ